MKNVFMRRSIASLVFLLAAGAAFADEPARNAELHALFERLFKQNLEEHPEFATFLGVEGYEDRLADRSPAAIARRKARLKETIAELKRFDPAQLSAQDRISRDVMLENLTLKDQMNALYGHLPFSEGDGWMPISPMHGPQELRETGRPDFVGFREFVANTYLRACRKERGASSLPGGPRY